MLVERIIRIGIEVDDIIDYIKDIKKLVVGYVLLKMLYLNVDKLNIC